MNIAFGLGYNFNEFSTELRVYSKRNVFMNHFGVWADYNN